MTLTTRELEYFETRVKRLVYLSWLLRWFEGSKGKFESFLAKARAEGHVWLPSTFQEVGEDLVRFVSSVSNSMLWTFYDEYNRTVNKGPHGEPHDDTESIVRSFPKYSVQCHPTHERVHVLRAVEDIRNRFIHPHIERYRWLTCDMSPGELLNHLLFIARSGDDRESLPIAERTPREEHEIYKFVSKRMGTMLPEIPELMQQPRFSFITFGELLEEVLVDSLRAYDVKVERRRRKA